MATFDELRNQLIKGYENKYGKDSVVEIREQKIHDWMYQFIIFYIDDNGIVRANHDCYAYLNKKTNQWYWYNRNPIPEIPKTTNLFSDKLNISLKNAIKNNLIKYAEIININNDIEKARVYIKDDSDEGIYIVGLDENGNIVREKTNLSEIKSG